MRTLLLSLLFTFGTTLLSAQAPQCIRLTKGDGDLTTAKTRMDHMRRQMVIFSNEGEKDRGTYKFLSDSGLLTHIYVGRTDATNDCFVFYFDPKRQSPADIQQDLALLKKFVYDGAATFNITVLQAEPMQMN